MRASLCFMEILAEWVMDPARILQFHYTPPWPRRQDDFRYKNGPSDERARALLLLLE